MPKQTIKSITNKHPRIAYTISLRGKDLKVLYSANAWWMDRTKIPMLIAAFGINATILEACAYAEITLKQYKYFTSLHPEFNEIKELYKAKLTLAARKAIADGIEHEVGNKKVKLAQWYLSKKLPDEFGKPSVKRAKLLTAEQRQRELEMESKIPGKNIPYPEDEKIFTEAREALKKNWERRMRGLPPAQNLLPKLPPKEIDSKNIEQWDDNESGYTIEEKFKRKKWEFPQPDLDHKPRK